MSDPVATASDALRHQNAAGHDEPLFGTDFFGRWSERIARLLGTPAFLIGQTVVTIAWIGMNLNFLFKPFDPYPFILLNLAYSIQSGFAAPFILCAQVRQDNRDKTTTVADAHHREELALKTHALLAEVKLGLEVIKEKIHV
jgi:uncharacterized membrane protein